MYVHVSRVGIKHTTTCGGYLRETGVVTLRVRDSELQLAHLDSLLSRFSHMQLHVYTCTRVRTLCSKTK